MKQYAPNRCEPSIEVSVRMGGRGHGAYDQRIKVIAKMQKKVGWVGEGGGWVGVDMNKELVIVKIAKKKLRGSDTGVGWGSEWMRTTN